LPQLDVRDRALATELVYGTLRAWSGLEHALLALTVMGGYVVRGLFVQEGFGFPTHLK
jgi:hypothetical protein